MRKLSPAKRSITITVKWQKRKTKISAKLMRRMRDHIVKEVSSRVGGAGTRSQLHNVTRKLRDITWKGFSFFTFFTAFPRCGSERRRDTELRWKRGRPDVTRRTVITRTSRASESFELNPGDVSICVAAGMYHLSNENDGSCAKGSLRARTAARQFTKISDCRVFSSDLE